MEDFVFASCEDICDETQNNEDEEEEEEDDDDKDDADQNVSNSEGKIDTAMEGLSEFRATTLEDLANSDYIRNR